MTKLTLQQALELALQHHQAGRLGHAEKLYRQVLDYAPQHPDALHLMGVLASQNGEHAAAVGFIERAIAVNPDVADFHNNLGEALRRSGQFPRAIESYQKAIALRPQYADAFSNLAAALNASGKHDDAAAAARTAMSTNPDDPEPHYNLAIAVLKLGDAHQAAQALSRAIQIAPQRGEFHEAMGDALNVLGRADHAIAAYKQSVQLKGGNAKSLQSLADTLMLNGRIDEAIETFRKLCEMKPDATDAHNNLGLLLERKGRFDEALKEYEAAIQLGGSPEAHNNLGNHFGSQSKLDLSLVEYRKAIEIDPKFYEAWSNLANTLVEMGELDESLAAYRKALELNPAFAGARSNMLLAMLYNPALSAEELIHEHKLWDETHGKALEGKIKHHENERSPDRPLRIGYVSPDFRSHAVAFFSLPVIESHDRKHFEVICYSNSLTIDGITARFQKLAAGWHSIVAMSDEQVAEMIRGHGIDILVDLAGHTANNRLPVFAMKPAPIQITAWGYPHSTGLSSIDYKISDQWCDPAGAESLNSEQLTRIPHSFWCYHEPDDSPPTTEPPYLRNGYLTFGCFNTLAKITPQVMELWSRLLHAHPRSRLILKANALASNTGKERVNTIFASHGINPERLELLGRGGFREYQELFNRVDLTLDPFPYNGGTTTCHSLWMAAPVVTLAGQSHQGRMGASILNCVGLSELVAHSPEEYVTIVNRFVNDLARAADLRKTMRDRMRSSPLMDSITFTRNLEAAYRQMWTAWCAR